MNLMTFLENFEIKKKKKSIVLSAPSVSPKKKNITFEKHRLIFFLIKFSFIFFFKFLIFEIYLLVYPQFIFINFKRGKGFFLISEERGWYSVIFTKKIYQLHFFGPAHVYLVKESRGYHQERGGLVR